MSNMEYNLKIRKSSFYPKCNLNDKRNFKRIYLIQKDGTVVEKVILNVIDSFKRETIILFHYLSFMIKRFYQVKVGVNVISRDNPWDFRVETSENETYNIEITSIAESKSIFKNYSSEDLYSEWCTNNEIPLHKLNKILTLFPQINQEKATKELLKNEYHKNDFVSNQLYSESETIFLSKIEGRFKNPKDMLIEIISKKADKSHAQKDQTVIIIDNRTLHFELDDFLEALPDIAKYCASLDFPEVWLYTGYCSDDDGNNSDYSFIPIKVRENQESILNLKN
ncbi:TPA: hypothetical protein RQK01_002325 [Vibrio vulnificus]|nr:hypothetical protein [Vibrio vulnificus]